MRNTSVASVLLLLLLASAGYSQTPTIDDNREIPDFSVQVWGDTARAFSVRVRRYADLRSNLEKGLIGLTITDDPAQIERAESALAREIRLARAEAGEGEIFTPTITARFKKVLTLEMNASTWAAIMDDNPREFSHRINGTYPKRKPLSTVPPTILARLPALPDDIQYRFLGRHLILYDTRANLIIDHILYAITTRSSDR
jgi:hypothetical protein